MAKNPNRELAKRQLRRLKAKEHRERIPRQVSDFALLGRWLAGIGGAALFTLVGAAFLTPMLAITEIDVVGVNRVTEEQVQTRLETVLGESLTKVSEEQVARLLADLALIDTVSVESRPPHTLLVRIQEREPIVSLKVGGEYFLYDAAGVKIGPADGETKLPKLINVGNPLTSSKFAPAVGILMELPQSIFSDVESLEVAGDSATIRLRDFDFDVIWGTKAESALKTEVLKSILESLEAMPELVDVSSPMAPVVRY